MLISIPRCRIFEKAVYFERAAYHANTQPRRGRDNKAQGVSPGKAAREILRATERSESLP